MSRFDPPRILVLFLVLLATACGRRVDVETSTDPYGRAGSDGPTYTRSTTLRSEDALEKAGRLSREGDFEGAIEIYRDIYRRGGSMDSRATALYEWARVEGNLLNPERDLDGAIARLELLLEEFPDATVAFRAREELARLRTFQSSSGQPRG